MRLTWTRRRHAPVPAVDRLQFVIWDFLRMLTGAIAAGFAVSLAAAGLTLLLAGRAEAASLDQARIPPPGPGVLLVGAGCDSVALQASERDWLVRIDGNTATVRVMQTFLLPLETDLNAVFNAVLPPGARMTSLQMQTVRRDAEARLLSATRHDAMSPAAYRAATSSAILVRIARDGEIVSSPLPGMEDGQTITLTYAYAIEVTSERDRLSIDLPLTEAHRIADDGFDDSRDNMATSNAVGGAVWVEWTRSKPRRLDSVPGNAHVERDQSQVESLAWESASLMPAARFRLAWAY